MNINIEKEYKILVSKSDFHKLLALYPDVIFKQQINTYYDTSDFQIRKAYGAMRIRETDSYLFTLKMHSEEGLLEYELPVEQNNEFVFQNKEILNILTHYGIRGPFIKLATLTTNRAMIISEDAELCFDISEYNGKIDYEIEYEYKRPHDGRKLFNNILKYCDLQYEYNCDSKIKRAMDSLK